MKKVIHAVVVCICLCTLVYVQGVVLNYTSERCHENTQLVADIVVCLTYPVISVVT